MHLGKRDWFSLRYVLARKETYVALVRAFRVFDQPFSVLRDELFSSSLHRDRLSVRTPIGRVQIRLNGPVDMSTVMGVFCREDYRLDRDARIIMDIGANIGIASLYFLTRSSKPFVYAYEPVPGNIQTFRENTLAYSSRCKLFRTAVAGRSGTGSFGIEPTGKFGGFKLAAAARIEVPCTSINDELERVLSEHGRVDCLKVDVEGTETEILSSIDLHFWDRINCVYAENCDSRAFMPPHFRRTVRYNVEQIRRI
jgi:FkbM family methyltransferase